MINSITTYNNEQICKYKKIQNQIVPLKTQLPVAIENRDTKLDSKFLHSYLVSFGSLQKSEKSSEIDRLKRKFTPPSQKIWDRSVKIAEEYGHKEVTYSHLFKAVLESVDKYIDDLDSKRRIYNKNEATYAVTATLEEAIDTEIFKDKNKRAEFKEIIQEEMKLLDESLAEQPKAEEKVEKVGVNRDLVGDINTYYMESCAEQENEFVPLSDSVLFEAIMFSQNDDTYLDLAEPFRTKLQEKFMIDKKPITEKPHIKFFDSKAKDIWKNLSMGNDMFLLYDKDTNPEYLVNSFANLMQVQNQQFSNLNKDNTDIVVLKKNATFDFLERKVEKLKDNPDKTTVVVVNFDDITEDVCLFDEANFEVFKNSSNTDLLFKEDTPSNVKFLVLCSKDKYYSRLTSGEFSKVFENFGDLSLPILNPDETKKVLKDEPVLTKKIGKNFSPKAIDRCVEFTHTQKGNYPEKTLSLMKSIATYYVDKTEISQADVDKYIKEVKESSKFQTNGDSSFNIIFDTKVKLKDMVGSEATKSEAQAIVNQIKKKSIGTKGFVIYSEDGVPGSGRRYTAEAIAGEAKIPFIPINAYDFGTKEVDLFEGGLLSPEASIKKLFNLAKVQAEANPHKAAVIFIENFENFASDQYSTEYDQKAFSQLLKEMENASKTGKINIIVIGSVNDPDLMGESAVKSFKFIDNIAVESPSRNVDARYEILSYYAKKKKLKLAGETQEEKDALIRNVAETTEGFPFIMLKLLLDKAKNVAIERKHKVIDKADFTESYLQITSGRPSSKQDSLHRKEIVTSHECGHALNLEIMYNLAKKQNIPWFLPDRVDFITLDPRGDFGGAMHHKESENDEFNFETLFANIICSYGGHSCEKRLYKQDGSWGIGGDMQHVTYYAELGVKHMGLGPNTGKRSVEDGPFKPLSPTMQRKVDKDMDVFLKNSLLVSDKIVETYEDFVREFTERHKNKVGTGECIIQGEVFRKELEDWMNRQSPEKKKELEKLDSEILEIINDTKQGNIVKND